MNVWIDLANSPQVLVFRPLLSEMERRGHRVFITTRAYAQTVALADRYGIQHTPVGTHDKRRWLGILPQTFTRARALVRWVQNGPPIDLAVSHNSLGQALAAARLGIPFVTLMDYEYQPANHFIFRSARRVIVPESFPNSQLRAFGAEHKTKKYRGVKEQLYLSDIHPEPNFPATLDVDLRKPLIVMRPPAPWAAYHRNFTDTMFDDVLNYIAAQDVNVIFLPRVAAQSKFVRARGCKNIWIPPHVLDGPNLVLHANTVISGGGTMNREAGILGTPAYTVFKGKLGAVDEWLVTRNRLKQITSSDQFPEIAFHAKSRLPILADSTLADHVTTLVLESV